MILSWRGRGKQALLVAIAVYVFMFERVVSEKETLLEQNGMRTRCMSIFDLLLCVCVEGLVSLCVGATGQEGRV